MLRLDPRPSSTRMEVFAAACRAASERLVPFVIECVPKALKLFIQCGEKEVDRAIEVVLLPCKHRIMCSQCAAKVQSCPMCRQPIQERMSTWGR